MRGPCGTVGDGRHGRRGVGAPVVLCLHRGGSGQHSGKREEIGTNFHGRLLRVFWPPVWKRRATKVVNAVTNWNTRVPCAVLRVIRASRTTPTNNMSVSTTPRSRTEPLAESRLLRVVGT